MGCSLLTLQFQCHHSESGRVSHLAWITNIVDQDCVVVLCVDHIVTQVQKFFKNLVLNNQDIYIVNSNIYIYMCMCVCACVCVCERALHPGSVTVLF